MITPLDIENKKFNKQVMNGYNVNDVDDFLDELVEDYEKNYRELAEANDKIDKLLSDLEQYKSIETTLRDTLVTAQTTAEDVKNVAKQQAEQIINEAKTQADEILNQSKAQADEILKQAQSASGRKLDDIDQQIIMKQKRMEEVKQQFDIYKAKMESLLISQEELIKEINKDDE